MTSPEARKRSQTPTPERLRPWVAATLLASLTFGIGARLAWPYDMEWKGDEIYSVEQARKVLETGEWPATGMGTSVGVPNPGYSLWAFVPLVAAGRSPVGVCVLVMLLNTAALLGLASLAALDESRGPGPTPENSPTPPLAARLASREAWLWGIGLMAVNPYVVRISRKIWPPSLLAPLVLLLCVGRARRETRLGAFAWGLAGAVMGQVHLSGYFLAGGLFLQSLADRLRGRDRVPIRWTWWAAGGLCGAVGLISWLLALGAERRPPPTLGWSVESFYLRITLLYWYWAELALGRTAWASYTGEFGAFLSRPEVAGASTHVFRLLYEALYWLGLFGIVTWAARLVAGALPGRWSRRLGAFVRCRRRQMIREVPDPWRRPVRGVWLGLRRMLSPRAAQPIARAPDSRYFVSASGLAGAGLLILTCRIIHLHYVYAFAPFVFVWLAGVFAARRRMLALILALQAALTLAMLVDLHARGGAARGDYGVSYRAQGR